MSEHAFLSPSDAEGWLNCPGKPTLCAQFPDESNEASKEGTLAHEYAAALLYGQSIDVPADLRESVNTYVQGVEEQVKFYEAGGGKVSLMVEQKLDISMITGERHARGTADVIMLVEYDDHAILEVRDYKHGINVEVDVTENKQLRIYALAAYYLHRLLNNITEIYYSIHQPRVRKEVATERVAVEDLVDWGFMVSVCAEKALAIREGRAPPFYVPGEKQCRFCRAKAICPELRKRVADEVFGEFEDLDAPKLPAPVEPPSAAADKNAAAILGRNMALVPLIETWCRAVRGRVESELLAGRAVPGFKLVEGRKGARAWADVKQVTTVLTTDGQPPELIFVPRALKSPAQLEKELQGKPVWDAVAAFIKQSDGKPSVAPADDPRPPYTPVSQDDFVNYSGDNLA